MISNGHVLLLFLDNNTGLKDILDLQCKTDYLFGAVKHSAFHVFTIVTPSFLVNKIYGLNFCQQFF